MLGEKENFKYLEILEANNIKVEMKEKNKTSGPQKNEKTSQNQALW